MRNKKRRANSWLVFSVQYISIALKMRYSLGNIGFLKAEIARL